MHHLSKLKKIEIGLYNVSHLPKGLEEFTLIECINLDDDIIKQLSLSCNKLKNLHFDYCQEIEYEGIKHLSLNCKSLEKFRLLTDKELAEQPSTFPTVESPINNEVIKHLLINCINLKELHLQGHHNLCIDKIFKHLPPQLVSLKLDHGGYFKNKMKNFPKHLKTLVLDYCSISLKAGSTPFPEGLRNLSLRHAIIMQDDDDIHWPKSLKKLDISDSTGFSSLTRKTSHEEWKNSI